MNKIYHKLPEYLTTSLMLAFLLPQTAIAFDLMTNGFGTVCANKSDLPKYAFVNIPDYPFPTQLGTVKPYVAATEYTPAYIGAERRWTFLPNSKFGLQFTGLFNDKFKAVTQIVGRAETMTNDHFYAQMDWAYVQYNPTNDLDFQVGRFRLPSFYYSDYLDVTHAQPWVMPPDEVYFIVGDTFRNMDGIKARYAYYLGDWTVNSKLWFGSMEEKLNILEQDIIVMVRDVVGGALQLESDRFSIGGSLMRSIYDTTVNDALSGLVTFTTTEFGSFPAATQFQKTLVDKDVPIVYLGLSVSANIMENLDFLAERASILSRGIISTAREGWYGSLTYSWTDYAFTLTYGFSRPLQTEINKYNAAYAFFNSPQYLSNAGNPDQGSGAGNAVLYLFQSYLGEQRSLALDVRYDVLPSLALKGSVKCVKPVGQKGQLYQFTLNRVMTKQHIWVYRLSLDFVF